MSVKSNPRRLKLQLAPDPGEAITISRDKVRLFKALVKGEADEGLNRITTVHTVPCAPRKPLLQRLIRLERMIWP